MGLRKVSSVKVGDLVNLEGRQGTVVAKARWQVRGEAPREPNANLDGYTLTVRFGDVTRPYHFRLAEKVDVVLPPREAA